MANTVILHRILKKHGYSMTTARKLVFVKLQYYQPLSVAKLAQHCAPKVDRASVYRSVALFEKLGIISRVWLGLKSYLELSELFSPHHHHLTCLRCGAVIAVEDAYLENALDQVAQRFSFAPSAHNIEISGTCQVCATASS